MSLRGSLVFVSTHSCLLVKPERKNTDRAGVIDLITCYNTHTRRPINHFADGNKLIDFLNEPRTQ